MFLTTKFYKTIRCIVYLPRIAGCLDNRRAVVALTGQEIYENPKWVAPGQGEDQIMDDHGRPVPQYLKRELPFITSEFDRLKDDIPTICARAIQIARNDCEAKDFRKEKAVKLRDDENDGGGNPEVESKAVADRAYREVMRRMKKMNVNSSKGSNSKGKKPSQRPKKPKKNNGSSGNGQRTKKKHAAKNAAKKSSKPKKAGKGKPNGNSSSKGPKKGKPSSKKSGKQPQK
ncbi:uncharacterized protein EDB91DRAFT_1086945 [Suillus paluster]|uniref:uncharacterized protein n=1 Tax=Suillus paluster TaxID=48578 RepID=UPI001B869DFA|nr:uncharacterized protein EDB91DRAFT_1086945 [Suillus paluster]KAG1726034.1 hypothetical protein EDB91DRAFT_1086945 [Suillus paluster]